MSIVRHLPVSLASKSIWSPPAARMRAKIHITSINESEDRGVWSFTVPYYTDLSYLVSVPNFSMKQFELQKTISQLFNAVKSLFFFACELLSDRLFQTIE